MASLTFNREPVYVGMSVEEGVVDVIKVYKIDNEYQCPLYCGINHIHKINADTYSLTFDKNSKIKIYLQK